MYFFTAISVPNCHGNDINNECEMNFQVINLFCFFYFQDLKWRKLSGKLNTTHRSSVMLGKVGSASARSQDRLHARSTSLSWTLNMLGTIRMEKVSTILVIYWVSPSSFSQCMACCACVCVHIKSSVSHPPQWSSHCQRVRQARPLSYHNCRAP